MKKLNVMIAVALLLAIASVGINANTVQAQAAMPSITLSPTSGFSAITIEGTGFSAWTGITVYWDGDRIPAIVDTEGEVNFTAIISVPTQTSPGSHEITVVDGYKATAGAVFRVVDMTGPVGPAGTSVTGLPGINCWDLNENRVADEEEDVNGDGVVDVLDCRGPQGEEGPPGDSTVIEGAEGPRGPAGPAGEPGEDGKGIVWRGEWSVDEEYIPLDAVSYEKSSYISVAPSSGATPSESADKWDLMASVGEAGEEGEAGEAGGGGGVGTTGFFLGLIALLLIAGAKIKQWTIG
ncbi:MAG: IPT/TIG domain-containing protein [Dehalococcoidia bacterium]